jgi:hypothetical protein
VSRRSPVAIAAGLLTVAAAAAGCSSGVSSTPNGTSVATLITSLKSAFASAQSVRIVGTGTFSGHAVTLNLGMHRSGDISGTITAGPLSEMVLSSSGSTYIYVSRAFFSYIQQTQHVPASACAAMCDKWLKVPSGSISSFSLSALSNEFIKKVPTASSVPHLTTTTYEGQAAYKLSNDKGEEIFITQSSPHYLLGIVKPGTFTMNFSEWNAVPPVSPPPANKVFTG